MKNNEQPILFSAEMARAILDGRKTQTRRVIKSVPELAVDVTHNNAKDVWFWVNDYSRLEGEIKNRFGKPGEYLWVKESFGERKKRNPDVKDHIDLVHYAWRYKADAEMNHVTVLGRRGIQYEADLYKWKSPLFMPRDASRITLEITGIRVEHLQDISKPDIEAEGVLGDDWHEFVERFESIAPPGSNRTTEREYFAGRWDKINGKKYPWVINPWVWVIEFKRMEKQNEK